MELENPMTFDDAVLAIKTLSTSPTNEEKLQIYALFFQSMVGDNNTPSPSFFDFTGSAKWKAWNEVKGLLTDTAKTQYISLVQSLIAKYNVK
jgi:diazepam-binding inhibitor (GABA receptor modulating acyl-CoA-binding protein)